MRQVQDRWENKKREKCVFFIVVSKYMPDKGFWFDMREEEEEKSYLPVSLIFLFLFWFKQTCSCGLSKGEKNVYLCNMICKSKYCAPVLFGEKWKTTITTM